LAEIAPDRVRSVPTLADALPELGGRSEAVRQALAASGVDAVLTGRCRGVFGDAWMPHYLIMAAQPSEREADRLVALARTGTRMAAGYLVPGDVQGATWTWDVDENGRLHAGVLGFDVDAQLVADDEYRGVFELFRAANRLDPVELPGLGGGAEPPAAQPSSVEIRLLGPIEVRAPGGWGAGGRSRRESVPRCWPARSGRGAGAAPSATRAWRAGRTGWAAARGAARPATPPSAAGSGAARRCGSASTCSAGWCGG